MLRLKKLPQHQNFEDRISLLSSTRREETASHQIHQLLINSVLLLSLCCLCILCMKTFICAVPFHVLCLVVMGVFMYLDLDSLALLDCS
jgi:hypothetical protein